MIFKHEMICGKYVLKYKKFLFWRYARDCCGNKIFFNSEGEATAKAATITKSKRKKK